MSRLMFEQWVYVGNINKFIITLASSICHKCKSGVIFFTIFAYNLGTIIWNCGEQMFMIFVGRNNLSSKNVMHNKCTMTPFTQHHALYIMAVASISCISPTHQQKAPLVAKTLLTKWDTWWSVATLALGSQPRQKGLQGCKIRESHHMLLGV
jgi:hypothetical protein